MTTSSSERELAITVQPSHVLTPNGVDERTRSGTRRVREIKILMTGERYMIALTFAENLWIAMKTQIVEGIGKNRGYC
jgi:hypothetical protein